MILPGRWLIACEKSGVIRRAFRERGVEAWSCDLEDAEDGSEFHIKADAIATAHSARWDGMICHPECKYISASGLHWNKRAGYEWRAAKTEAALDFAVALWTAPIPRICLENPKGCLPSRIGPASQIVQPYQFGDPESKETHFWLKGLPPLRSRGLESRAIGRLVQDPRTGKWVERFNNQTDDGQNKLGPSAKRSAIRAQTYPGLAAAMAEQWPSYEPIPMLL